MAATTPICISTGQATCLDRASLGTIVKGYYCEDDTCKKCPTGTTGDGNKCTPCPFGTWAPVAGSIKCGTQFTYSVAGLQKVYIPFGVTGVVAQLWGGGGGSDTSLDQTNLVSHSGGSGGFAACNLTVPHSRNIYIVVGGGGGSRSNVVNLGGFGGGGKGYSVTGISAGGGGGRSAVQIVAGVDALTAGGGGGGSDCQKTTQCGGGGAGGAIGTNNADTANGRGATEVAGGDPGSGVYCAGTAGAKYQGGNGCSFLNAAVSAGGGGGYYGGGGGASHGANNITSTPKVYETNGGGGGGSSYGGGCRPDTYYTKSGFNGGLLMSTRSGGIMEAHYLPGVGAGGNGERGGGNAGGAGMVRITFISNSSFIPLSAMPSSMPSSAPTGQPTSQPTSRPTAKIIQPSSRPTSASENPLFIPPISKQSMNGLDMQTAIIVFSCVGAVVLCLFILFTCYFQDKYYNHKEEDKLHNLVEQHYNDDEVVLDDGDGGRNVEIESGYYRQFGENDNPIHNQTDENGNVISNSLRSSKSMHKMNNSTYKMNGSSYKMNSSSYKMNGDIGAKKQSFVLRDNRKGTVVNRTSVSTLNGGSQYNMGSASQYDLNGNAMKKSSNQIVSQVRVTSFAGLGPAPRLIRMVTTTSSVDEAARANFIAAHQDEILEMQKFFRNAGLTPTKSQACAEEAICQEAHNPRKLFKYVHEVADFSLMNLGMDGIDEDMVNEALNKMFTHKDLTAEGAAKLASSRVGGARGLSGSNQNDSSPQPAEDRPKTAAELDKEHDIADMVDFFRYSGLSVKQSRACAESSVSMDANSPRKLFKYLEDVKGFHLTDLGMDPVDADMVLKTLTKEYSSHPATATKDVVVPVVAPVGGSRHDSVIVDNDLKDDSSDDGDDEVTTMDTSTKKAHTIKNVDRYEESPSMGNLTDRSQETVSTLATDARSVAKPTQESALEKIAKLRSAAAGTKAPVRPVSPPKSGTLGRFA